MDNEKLQLKRRRGACDPCKPKKVRCDGGRPCSSCQKSSATCYYAIITKKRSHNATKSADNGSTTYANTDVRTSSAQRRRCQSVNLGSSERPFSPISSRTARPHLQSTPDEEHTVLVSSETPNEPISDSSADPQSGSLNVSFPSDSYGGDWASFLDLNHFDALNFPLLSPHSTPQHLASLGKESERYPEDEDTHTDEVLFELPLEEPVNVDRQTFNTLSVSAPANLVSPRTEPIHLSSSIFNNPFTELRFPYQSIFEIFFKGLRDEEKKQQDYASILRKLEQKEKMMRRPEKHNLAILNQMLVQEERVNEYVEISCREVMGGIGCFISKSDIDQLLHEFANVEKSSPATQESVACLVAGSIALGAHILSATKPENHGSTGKTNAMKYFSIALSYRDALIYREESVLKLQVVSRVLLAPIMPANLQKGLITLANLSKRLNYQLTGGLISQALQCVYSLRSRSNRSVKECSSNPDDTFSINKAYWCLYSMEKSFCLLYGNLSMIDDGNIDFEPPITSAYSDSVHGLDWLSVQVSYGKLCSAVAKKFHHPKAAIRLLSDLERIVSQLHNSLNTWKESLPQDFQLFIADKNPSRASETGAEWHLKLQMSYQYHQAIFAIYGPIVMLQSSKEHSEGFQNFRASSEQICVSSARTVLLMGSYIHVSDVLLDYNLLLPPLLAVATIFRVVIENVTATRKDVSYLGLACGILGRISMEIDVPFAEVLELSTIAQGIVKEPAEAI